MLHAFAWLAVASAAELAGVTLPDTATVGGQPLVLNGLGLREKMTIDVYVGGLYLPTKTTDAAAAIGADTPKRIVMHFVYREVTKAQLDEAFLGDLAKIPDGVAQRANMEKLVGMLTAVRKGEEIAFDYVPGAGTTVRERGATVGTITGVDFMRALWSVYLGPHPPTAALKVGMLGP